jgi:hypothetical protein
MNFTDTKPTEPGFYWCKPVFSGVSYMDCDLSIEPGKLSIAEIVELKRMSCGTNLHARFIGHKIPHSLGSGLLRHTLWGERIKE